MKKLISIFASAFIIISSYGQTNTFPASGNVGIGTTTPTKTLDVNGDLNISGSVFSTNNNSTRFGQNALFSDDKSNNQNSAFGHVSLYYNTTGASNSAFGYASLYNNTTGTSNSAFGVNALRYNTTGTSNSAFGVNALYNNITGKENSAFGVYSLYYNTEGNYNSATGIYALFRNTTGSYNVANGRTALYYNTTGSSNVALGFCSLYKNTGGGSNVAIGTYALRENESGNYNVALGRDAGYGYNAENNSNINNNVLIGYRSGFQMQSGANYNTFLGHQTGYYLTTGQRNILIGYNIHAPVTDGSNQMSIGNIIYGTGVSSSGKTVSSGKIGIKNNAPAYDFDVNGDINATGTFRLNGQVLKLTDLDATGFNATGANIGSRIYHSNTIYNYSTGILLETDIATSDNRMIELEITGNGYGSANANIDVKVQAYNYITTGTIINAKGRYIGDYIPVDIFHYNGNVCFFLEQSGNYQTISFKLKTNTGSYKITNISNVLKPSGVSQNVTIEPYPVLTSKNANLSTVDWAAKNISATGTVSHAPPTADNHSATKLYVDDAIANSGSVVWDETGSTAHYSGKVGIGTTNPGNKLEVNGTIRSKEVIVETTGWPDFVFETSYDLKSLSEVESFIKENKHLPDIPSEKEVKENGIGVGEMNAKLLQKIEELILHTIHQQKLIERQQKRIDALEKNTKKF